MPQEIQVRVRPGLLDRLKKNADIGSDEAFARLIGSSRATLDQVRKGEREPSMAFAVGVCKAFKLGLGEVVEWDESAEKLRASA